MRLFVRMAIAALALGAPGAAGAQQGFFVKQFGHWTVTGSGEYCMAFNRPQIDMNSTPYNSISFLARKDGWSIQAYFWPGAFQPGSDATLILGAEFGRGVKLKAKAESEFTLRTQEPISSQLRDELARTPSKQLSVSAVGVTWGLVFDVADLGAVMRAMEDCAKQIAR